MEPSLAPVPLAADQDGPLVDDRPGGAFGVLGQLSPGQIIGLGVVLIGLLGFFAYLTLRVTEPDYRLLYGDLDLTDSAEVIGRLEALGVPYRLHGDGEAILVPGDRVSRLRMTLAEEGLPRGGSVGDEIFDQGNALGTTTFLATVNQRRALEGELARTIGALGDVKSARVHLVLPKRELFRREQIEPSASVSLKMFGGRRLDTRQIAAIQHLVAAAVPGLAPERVTLVDDRGTLLARGGDGLAEGALPSQADDYRTAYEARLKRVIEQLLERSLGPGQVHAEVNAEIDFDQVVVTEETFDPEGQVVRSTQSVEEETDIAERDQDDTVTVGNNLPNAGAEDGNAERTSTDNSTRTEETVNYEISRTVRNHTQVGGRVQRLSVAVLVGGRQGVGPDDEVVYQPLEQEELDEIAALVRSAIGFDAERGDSIEVKNLPFARIAAADAEASWLDFTKDDLMRLVELGVLLLVALMTILLVVRPILARLFPAPPSEEEETGAAGPKALAGPDGKLALAGPEGEPAEDERDGEPREEGELAKMMKVAQIEGQVRMDLVEEARQLIDQRTDDVVAVIRDWIDESSKPKKVSEDG